MAETTAAQFVVIRWPAWWANEPQRTERTSYFVGLTEKDGTVTLLVEAGKTIDAARALIREPAQIKLKLKLERDEALYRAKLTESREPENVDRQLEARRMATELTRKGPSLYDDQDKAKQPAPAPAVAEAGHDDVT